MVQRRRSSSPMANSLTVSNVETAEQRKSRVAEKIDTSLIEVTDFANRHNSFTHNEEFYRLFDSIQANGQTQPIRVRKKKNREGSAIYELVFGRQRLEICKFLGIKVLATIDEDLSDEELLRLQHEENLRDDVDYFANADNLSRLAQLRRENGHYKSDAQFAKEMGVSKATMSRLLSISAIPDFIRDNFLRNQKPHGEIAITNKNGDSEVVELYKQELIPLSFCSEKVAPAVNNASEDKLNKLQRMISSGELSNILIGAKSAKSKANWLLNFLTGQSNHKQNKKIWLKNSKNKDIASIQTTSNGYRIDLKEIALVNLDESEFVEAFEKFIHDLNR